MLDRPAITGRVTQRRLHRRKTEVAGIRFGWFRPPDRPAPADLSDNRPISAFGGDAPAGRVTLGGATVGCIAGSARDDSAAPDPGRASNPLDDPGSRHASRSRTRRSRVRC